MKCQRCRSVNVYFSLIFLILDSPIRTYLLVLHVGSCRPSALFPRPTSILRRCVFYPANGWMGISNVPSGPSTPSHLTMPELSFPWGRLIVSSPRFRIFTLAPRFPLPIPGRQSKKSLHLDLTLG